MLGPGREPGREGVVGPEGWEYSDSRTQLTLPLHPPYLEEAAAWYSEAGPAALISGLLFGCLLQPFIPGRTVESALGTGQGRGRVLLSGFLPLFSLPAGGPAQVS